MTSSQISAGQTPAVSRGPVRVAFLARWEDFIVKISRA